MLGTAHEGRGARDQHDLAASAFDEGGQRGPDQADRAGDVDVEAPPLPPRIIQVTH